MNERQRQASVTMRTRLVASECHLRDRFLVSHRGAAQVLDASPFRLTSEPSPHGHANHLAHDSAMVSALLDRSLASHTPCITTGQKKTGFRGRAVALSSINDALVVTRGIWDSSTRYETGFVTLLHSYTTPTVHTNRLSIHTCS